MHKHVFAGPDAEIDRMAHWLVVNVEAIAKNARPVPPLTHSPLTHNP